MMATPAIPPRGAIMKIWFSAALLIAASFAYGQDDEEDYFSCRVTSMGKVITLFCPVRNPSLLCKQPKYEYTSTCMNSILDIPVEHWPAQWPGAKVGATFKARYVDGKFTVIPSYEWCRAERAELIKEYCGHDSYCRPPSNSIVPDDC